MTDQSTELFWEVIKKLFDVLFNTKIDVQSWSITNNNKQYSFFLDELIEVRKSAGLYYMYSKKSVDFENINKNKAIEMAIDFIGCKNKRMEDKRVYIQSYNLVSGAVVVAENNIVVRKTTASSWIYLQKRVRVKK